MWMTGDVMVKAMSLPGSIYCLEKQKDYKIGQYISCLFDMHTEERNTNMDLFVQMYNGVSYWMCMSVCGLLFHWSNTIKVYSSVLYKYRAEIIKISSHWESHNNHTIFVEFNENGIYCEMISNRVLVIFVDFVVHINNENANLSKCNFLTDCWL